MKKPFGDRSFSIAAPTLNLILKHISFKLASSLERLNYFIIVKFSLCTYLLYRGYYMAARGYEFYLRVFNSISHE